MGSLYRSEPMQLCQLFLQTDTAYNCIAELGELGLVQFKDLNPNVSVFQRKYVNEVRRCEEMERKLRFLEKEIKRDEITVVDTGENPPAPLPREMTDLEITLERLENEIKDVISNTEALKRNYLDLTELKHILRKAHGFFDCVDREHSLAAVQPGLDEDDLIILQEEGGLSSDVTRLMPGRGRADPHGGDLLPQSLRISFLAGVIAVERLPAFELMLRRTCMGNVLLKYDHLDTPLEDPHTGNDIWKAAFLIFYRGDQLKEKITIICEGFHANMYPCPETQTDRRDMAMQAMTRLQDLEVVLKQTLDHRFRALSDAAQLIRVWFLKVLKIKSVYHTLNMFNFDVTQKCLIGECWCPVAFLPKIQLALRRGSEHVGSTISGAILNRLETSDMPPTYNRTNKFTAAFQDIVDSYGVATYREINPAPFSVISFPFLFSLMFGDAGHGTLLFLAGLGMVLMEQRLKKIKNEIWEIFFGGRYIILLMGAFSIYSGILYNDYFSKSFNMFGSSWTAVHYDNATLKSHKDIMLDPNKTDFKGHPYAVGMDPVWQLALNKISFLNSYKMKISVIFGVLQMTFGICLSFYNHKYFKERLNVICEFIPEMIFLLSIFGYLIILILHKWIAWNADWANCAPSLLIELINMFLFNYPKETVDPLHPPRPGCYFYPGKQAFQTLLLLVIVACIPWLLLPKPLLLRREHLRKTQGRNSSNSSGRSRSRALARRRYLNDDTQGGAYRPLLDDSDQESGDIRLGNDDELNNDDDDDGVTHHAESSRPAHCEEPHKEFDFSEIFIHQAIHTIEFCLGCISHTASYLRLWALSLAHAELSEVLWRMVLHYGFIGPKYVGALLLVNVFTPFAILTVGILIFMEGLSAFLHTLRLHWVEFQSKFYKGEGYKFDPFSFEKIQQELDSSE